MNSSLRDQLLKAGFVDQKKADRAERERKQQAKKARQARKSGQPAGPSAEDLAARRAREEQELHAQRSRELNRAREEERARKALRIEVRHLLEEGAEPHGKGDVRYHFVDGKKVKWLYVDKAQQAALARGDRAIAKLDGRFYVIPPAVTEQVRRRLPEVIVHVAEPETVNPDDPYAAYPIPDDLEW